MPRPKVVSRDRETTAAKAAMVSSFTAIAAAATFTSRCSGSAVPRMRNTCPSIAGRAEHFRDLGVGPAGAGGQLVPTRFPPLLGQVLDVCALDELRELSERPVGQGQRPGQVGDQLLHRMPDPPLRIPHNGTPNVGSKRSKARSSPTTPVPHQLKPDGCVAPARGIRRPAGPGATRSRAPPMSHVPVASSRSANDDEQTCERFTSLPEHNHATQRGRKWG